MMNIFKKANVCIITFVALFNANITFSTENDNNAAHAEHAMTNRQENAELAPTIKLNVKKIEKQGNKEHVEIELIEIKDNQQVTLDMLKEIHTKKIHFLIIDDSLTDYHHIHPTATKIAGIYSFDWQPKRHATYRIWADLFPLKENRQEYVIADLVTVPNEKQMIDRTNSTKSTVNGYTFTLSFETPKLLVGKPAMGKILVTDAKGNPVRNLEPIMGAFAHIVGFNEDFQSVVHIHPMGKEPNNLTERGGPELEFHITPKKPGFTKLFAQVLINGKELFVPFGFTISTTN